MVDLVPATVVLEDGDDLAGAGVVFRGPQSQAFLALAHAGLCGGSHQSALPRPDRSHLVVAPVQVTLIHGGGHAVVRPGAARHPAPRRLALSRVTPATGQEGLYK